MTPNPTSEDWPSIEAEYDYSLWRLECIKELADKGESPISALISEATGYWETLTSEADELMIRINELKGLLDR